MKSKKCKGCVHFFPKGTTPYSYDVCNFMLIGKGIQTLSECPNGKPQYREYKEDKQKDNVNEPFVIVTNCKTEKYFYAKNFSIDLKTHPGLDVRVTITPKDLNDIVPVIGKYSLSDCITKKECIGDNEKLHIEIFDENSIKQDEYFIYNVWVQSISYETNIITLCCDYVN